LQTPHLTEASQAGLVAKKGSSKLIGNQVAKDSHHSCSPDWNVFIISVCLMGAVNMRYNRQG